MHYRTIADLCDTIQSNLHRLPRDIDLVVGIPRSGFMAATYAALSLNVRLADLEGYLDGRLLSAGHTRRTDQLERGIEDLRHVLVVDDSINTGISLEQARTRIAARYPNQKVTYCSVYGLAASVPGCDLVLDVVPQPRLFQWNLMHHPLLERCCVDIDGVLCVDPTEEENDDGERYLTFLGAAVPLHVPSKRIGCLVTSRLERYRPQTEAWLRERGIEYGELVMLNLASKAERQAMKAHGSFKAEAYKQRSNSLLFIESDRGQAEQIMQLSGKPVLSLGTQELMLPGTLSAQAMVQSVRTLPSRLRITQQNKLLPAKRFARRLLGEALYQSLKQSTFARA